MAKCSLCGEVVSNIGKHRWEKHKEIAQAQFAKVQAQRHKGGKTQDGGKNGGKLTSSSGGAKPASSLEDASILAIAPRRFEMTSTLLWQARAAAIKEWNWPTDMTPEDFLDTFLFEAFKQCGIILGAYQVVAVKEREDDGHH